MSTLYNKAPERPLPIPGIVQPSLERKRRSAQNSPGFPSASPANTMLSRLNDYLNDDLNNLEDNLETSDNEVIRYMNNRVDTIVDTVHQTMEHSGH